MRTKLVLAIAALQIAVLAFMAGQREWILQTGRTVFLRTAPIDPRDVMRGDYVRLSYDLSRIPRSLWRGRLAEMDVTKVPRDSVVFTAIEIGEDGVAKLRSVSFDRPANGLYLRGRTEPSGNELQVRYGLEAFFMEQGKGAQLERERNRNGIQVPLEMKAAVGSGGIAVLKDHRWAPLGLGLTVETKETVDGRGQRTRRLVSATVQLLNASSNDLAVVDLPGNRSLTLIPEGTWGENKWQWTSPETNTPTPAPSNVIVLKPGQTHTLRISFADPRWTVLGKKTNNGPVEPVLLADLPQDWSARFRFEYGAPEPAQCAGLPSANLIWHGVLRSRAFSPAGGFD
jgi:uncharacterized membrane-anchored protein